MIVHKRRIIGDAGSESGTTAVRLIRCRVCPLIRSQILQGLMCNSRGLLRLPSPANTSRSGREIRLAPNQIRYQIVQFLDLVNVRLARNGPIWAQRGSADEVTEN